MKLSVFKPLRDAGASWAVIAHAAGCDWRTAKKYLEQEHSQPPTYGPAPVGYVLSTMALVAGVVTQLTYMTALVSQARAEVPGATAFDPFAPIIVAVYLVGAGLLLGNVQRPEATVDAGSDASTRPRRRSGGERMVGLHGEIHIARSCADVFDAVADERNRYDPRIRHAELLTAGPLGVGSRFRSVAASMGRPVDMVVEITSSERPRRLTTTTRTSSMDIHSVILFEPVA